MGRSDGQWTTLQRQTSPLLLARSPLFSHCRRRQRMDHQASYCSQWGGAGTDDLLSGQNLLRSANRISRRVASGYIQPSSLGSAFPTIRYGSLIFLGPWFLPLCKGLSQASFKRLLSHRLSLLCVGDAHEGSSW